MKKVTKIVSFMALSSVFFPSFAADLEKIEVIDNGNISANTTDLVLPKSEVKGDLKVLKDYVVSFAVKDPQDSKKLVLNLTYELEKNRDYTIIGIDGAEANMNFSIGDTIDGEYLNKDTSNSSLKIEKIVVSDPKIVEIYYNSDLTEEEFLFRFLSDLPVKSKFGASENKLNIVLDKPLEQLTPYIIISNSLEDSEGKVVKMDDTIYEFETEDNLINFFPELEVENEEQDIAVKDEGNVEEVAMNVGKTPDTGAATWVLILMTLFIVGIISMRFKKS